MVLTTRHILFRLWMDRNRYPILRECFTHTIWGFSSAVRISWWPWGVSVNWLFSIQIQIIIELETSRSHWRLWLGVITLCHTQDTLRIVLVDFIEPSHAPLPVDKVFLNHLPILWIDESLYPTWLIHRWCSTSIIINYSLFAIRNCYDFGIFIIFFNYKIWSLIIRWWELLLARWNKHRELSELFEFWIHWDPPSKLGY